MSQLLYSQGNQNISVDQINHASLYTIITTRKYCIKYYISEMASTHAHAGSSASIRPLQSLSRPSLHSPASEVEVNLRMHRVSVCYHCNCYEHVLCVDSVLKNTHLLFILIHLQIPTDAALVSDVAL